LAKYATRDMGKPIGLSEYRLTEAIPKEIKTNLPTIEQLEAELSKDFSKTYTAMSKHFLRVCAIQPTSATSPDL